MLPTPWNFADAKSQFHSPDSSQWLAFTEAGEMGQGGPLRGEYLWTDADACTVKLPGLYGGPPVWEISGHRVAIPRWTDSVLWGVEQRLAVLDTKRRQLIIFQKHFRVLHLQESVGLLVTGIDSPIHYPASVLFDTGSAAIKRVFEL